jgi:hypothetical protein
MGKIQRDKGQNKKVKTTLESFVEQNPSTPSK